MRDMFMREVLVPFLECHLKREQPLCCVLIGIRALIQLTVFLSYFHKMQE